jgi:hypothetical protein
LRNMRSWERVKPDLDSEFRREDRKECKCR